MNFSSLRIKIDKGGSKKVSLVSKDSNRYYAPAIKNFSKPLFYIETDSKKSGQDQKLAINKKSTIFEQST